MLGTVSTPDGTLGIHSTGAGVMLGSATSGGTQTVGAQTTLAYTTLTTTAGDIDLTSAGSIAGTSTGSGLTLVTDSLDAKGSFDLQGRTTISATLLTADTGTGTVTTGGAVTLGTVATPGGALGIQSTGSSVMIGSAASGGTQTVGARTDLTFATLVSTGGDIDATAATGSIHGTIATAFGSADLAAFDDNIGTALTTRTGGAVLTAQIGRIDWGTVNAATTFDATASTGGITFGTATSGGTQILRANADLDFGQLTTLGGPGDRGDVTLVSYAGAVRGGSIAANGSVFASGVGIDFDVIDAVAGVTLISSADIAGTALSTQGTAVIEAATTVAIGNINAASLAMSTPGAIAIGEMTIATAVDLAAQNITVGELRQAAGVPGPLMLSLTGYAGGIGQTADLAIDAPNGLFVSQLSENTVSISTTARQVTIADALLTGTMRLVTPTSNLWFNDVSSGPVLGNDVQFYRPDDRFYLLQSGTDTITNSYIVQYDSGPAIHEDVNGVIYNGASLVRDIDRQGRVGDDGLFPAFDDDAALWHFPVEAFDRHLAHIRTQVLAPVNGAPALNLQQGRSAAEGFKIVFKRP